MDFVTYIFFLLLVTIIGITPFFLLYRLADFVYFMLYRIIGYRKPVVSTNLKKVFPDKTEKELKQIEKASYRNLADIFVEGIKGFTMSKKSIMKRHKFLNPEIFEPYNKKNQAVIIAAGHYGNWEWVFSLASLTEALPIATYLKINNPYFERFMLHNRSRFGGLLIETKQLRQTVAKLAQENRQFILGLLADQSPQRHRTKYWRSFLDVPDVPVFVGPEKLAKQYDAAFVFIQITKQKRGYYTVDFELITNHPKTYPDYQLTDIFVDKLTQQIKAQPAYYLWTHNRFKHQGKQTKK